MMVLIACPAVLKTAAPAQLFSNSWKKEFGTVDLFGFSSGFVISCWVGCTACACFSGCGSFCSFCLRSSPRCSGDCGCGCGCRCSCGCLFFFVHTVFSAVIPMMTAALLALFVVEAALSAQLLVS